MYWRIFYDGVLRKAPNGTERIGGTPPGRQAVPVARSPMKTFIFYVKRIDNSRVVRQTDPQAGGVCWKMIGSVAAAAVLLIGVLLPSAYGLLAGYQIQSLRGKSPSGWPTSRRRWSCRKRSLLSPARMEELAREQQFIDPEPEKVVYLDSTHGAAVAMNQAAAGVAGDIATRDTQKK